MTPENTINNTTQNPMPLNVLESRLFLGQVPIESLEMFIPEANL